MGDQPRTRAPIRNQVELHQAALDDLVPADHPVRAMWSLVTKFDLSKLFDLIQARGSAPGRAANDPRVLLCLWVLATSEGVASARALARLCERDIIYRWICGGTSPDYHALSDFRSQRGAEIDDLMSQVIAMLMKAKVVNLAAAAQDGTKVRACAGAGSFRREETLDECLATAKKEVARLKTLCDDESDARQVAARKRAAEERQEAIEAALRELPKVLATRSREADRNGKRAGKRGEPRVSTTDPEARIMRMADGGYRPAMNVQLATDVDSGCIIGVKVTNSGTDVGEVESMLAEILRRTAGELPLQYLLDGGYVGLANIEGLAQSGIEPFAPVPKSRNAAIDPHEPKRTDSAEVAEWRQRMESERAKNIYKQRGATAERTNADLKSHRGLSQLLVRGLTKATTVVLLGALTFNILRCISAGVT